MAIPNSQICFILLPGLAPDPIPVLRLKLALENRGYVAIASNFFGEKTIDNFSNLTIDQCKDGISELIKEARKKYHKIIGIGISLGGALLMEHAKKDTDLDAIISIGTPFKLKYRFFMRLGQALIPVVNPAWSQFQKYKSLRLFPIGAANMTINYLKDGFVKDLDLIDTPTLLIHSKKDDICDHQAISEFLPRFSMPVEVIMLNDGSHTIDRNPELIVKYAELFLNKLKIGQSSIEG